MKKQENKFAKKILNKSSASNLWNDVLEELLKKYSKNHEFVKIVDCKQSNMKNYNQAILISNIKNLFDFNEYDLEINITDFLKDMPVIELKLVNKAVWILNEKEESKSKYGYPKVVCYKCKKKRWNWCKKFKMPILLALQTNCNYGNKLEETRKERKKIRNLK